MQIIRRLTTIFLCATALGVAATSHARQDFPNKPVRLVVPFSPGSGTDNTARYLAREMEAKLGTPVVVENRPGGNSFIATQAVAGADPDGYTLLVSGSSAMTVNKAVFKDLPYDPIKDFEPVARLANGAMGLAVQANSPYRTVSDLVIAAKKRPGELNYGSGSAAYEITTELFLSMADASATHVPYKGAAQAMTDLAGGQLDFVFADYAATLPFVRSDKVRLLAVTSAHRLESATDVPTLAEQGFPGYDMVNWTSVFAPAGTPPEVIERLSNVIVEIYDGTETREFLAKTNWESFPTGPEELRAYQQQEIEKWQRAAEVAGIEKQ